MGTTINNNPNPGQIQGPQFSRTASVMAKIEGLSEGVKNIAAQIQLLVEQLKALEPPEAPKITKDMSDEQKQKLQNKYQADMQKYESEVARLTSAIEGLEVQMQDKQKQLNQAQGTELTAAQRADREQANREADEARKAYEEAAQALDNSGQDKVDDQDVNRAEIRTQVQRREDGSLQVHVEVTMPTTQPDGQSQVALGQTVPQPGGTGGLTID